jgi:SIT4-associating protein SAP185/190
VAVSGLLDEVRGGSGSGEKGTAQGASEGESKDVKMEDVKVCEDEDVFVDEPLSPTVRTTDTSTSDSGSKGPVPAPIPADYIPRLDKMPIPAPPSDLFETSVPMEDRGAKPVSPNRDEKEKSEDAPPSPPPPPPPPKDDKPSKEAKDTGEKSTEEKGKNTESAEEDLLITDVPKAPSPPPVEADDDSLLKGGRSLVADLKAASIPAPLNPQPLSVPQERMDAELPPLPQEALDKSKQHSYPEEDLLDLSGGSPYSTTTLRSTGNLSFEEYETMIEKDFDGNPVVGDYLKMMFVENQVVPTILVCFIQSMFIRQ